jgi:hypothetical protein
MATAVICCHTVRTVFWVLTRLKWERVRCGSGAIWVHRTVNVWYEHAVRMNDDGTSNVLNMKLKPECPKVRQGPKWK